MQIILVLLDVVSDHINRDQHSIWAICSSIQAIWAQKGNEPCSSDT